MSQDIRSQDARELFVRRMEIVQEIARLNARQLHDQQILSGRQLELAAYERDADGDTATLCEARAQVEATTARLAEDAVELELWDGQLDDIDRRISGGREEPVGRPNQDKTP
ncbi:MAG TPA: hypothetical protein VIQ29_25645 [Ancylobacter sp.]